MHAIRGGSYVIITKRCSVVGVLSSVKRQTERERERERELLYITKGKVDPLLN